MSIPFNADEIFEMAEQIERNGAKFYRRASEEAADSESHQLLLDLAAMEDEHEKIFAAMRADMLKQGQMATVDPALDPEGQAVLYLRAMADGQVFNMREDPSEHLTGEETMDDILQTAIGLEKDSIVFYLGMKEMVPERLGKGKIDDVIKEEMGHITTLSGKLASLKS
jgi:rubrerythrin